MENITLNTEHQLKNGLGKQKKQRKPELSFFEILKHGQKLTENISQVKSQKSVSKISNINKQDTKKLEKDSYDSQIFANINQTKEVKHDMYLLLHTGYTQKGLFYTREPQHQHNLLKNIVQNIPKDKEIGNIAINLVNLQQQEKNTEEKIQTDKGIVSSITQKVRATSVPEDNNRLLQGDKFIQSMIKQEADNTEYYKTQNIENRENSKKPVVKEPMTERNHNIKNPDVKNNREQTEQLFNLNRGLNEWSYNQEVKEYPTHIWVESGRLNQDTRHSPYNTQETHRPDVSLELSVEPGVVTGDFLTDGKSYGGESMNSQYQTGNNPQLAAERITLQNRFSFSFMDTKINIQTNQNIIIMHINTLQSIDPSTVEKIRQILLENGFTNHNLILRDRTKTAKIYTTNRAYTENRNGDGFKISA